MEHIYNDGGRSAAGFKGSTGDCVTRAIAIAAGLPYQDVYDRIQREQRTERANKRGKRSNARTGVFTGRAWFKRYMALLGFEWVSCMAIGTGCTVHLIADELPAGRIIVSLSRHYAAIIDGVLHDTYDSSARGTFLYSANWPDIPKGAKQRDDGQWLYAPKRCVYGYWQLAK